MTGLASDFESTSSSTCFLVPDGRLIICDTPGSNAMVNTFRQNVWIAQAMNFQPVSKILVVVKADCRIDNVVGRVTEYDDRFLDMDADLMGVIVTHMDTVQWSRDTCVGHIRSRGINHVVFTDKDLPGSTLEDLILRICTTTHNISVDHENFLNLFKIGDYDRRIVRVTKQEVNDYRELYNKFFEERAKFPSGDVVDLIFEFVAWMQERIYEAKVRVSTDLGFTFLENVADEVGHIASMTNQMATILKRLRTEALGFQAGHGVDDLRRCNWCNQVWATSETCDDETTCGSRPTQPFDARSAVLGKFSFQWDGSELSITRSGEIRLQARSESADTFPGIGCGRTITWALMPTVEVPAAFLRTEPVNVNDVSRMPEVREHVRERWKNEYQKAACTSQIPMKKC